MEQVLNPPPPPLSAGNLTGRVKRQTAIATNVRIKECAEEEIDANQSDGDSFILDEEEEGEEENDGYETGGSFTSKNSEAAESEGDEKKSKLTPSNCSESSDSNYSCTDISDSESDGTEGITIEDNLCDYKNEPFPVTSDQKKKKKNQEKTARATCSTTKIPALEKNKEKQQDRAGMESIVGAPATKTLYGSARAGSRGRGRGAPRGPRATVAGGVTTTARVASRAAYIKRCAAKGVRPDEGLPCDDSGFGDELSASASSSSTPTKKAKQTPMSVREQEEFAGLIEQKKLDVARLEELARREQLKRPIPMDEVEPEEEETPDLVDLELESQDLLAGLHEPEHVGVWESDGEEGEEQDVVENEDFEALAALAKEDVEWTALNSNTEPALGSDTKRHGVVHPLRNGGFSYVRSQELRRSGVNIKNLIVNKGTKGGFENRIGVSEATHVLESILYHRRNLGISEKDFLMMHLRPTLMKFYHAFEGNYVAAGKLERQAQEKKKKKKKN